MIIQLIGSQILFSIRAHLRCDENLTSFHMETRHALALNLGPNPLIPARVSSGLQRAIGHATADFPFGRALVSLCGADINCEAQTASV